MKYAALTFVTLVTLALLACSELKTVETSDGNMSDHYTVDKEGRRHGEFRRFFGKDTLSELSHYVHGKLHGTRTIYNAHGNPEITETYDNDTLQGAYTVYYEDGKIKIEGEYADGVMRGIWKRYYPTGQILEEVTYEDNLENGPFVEYHENGKLRAKGQYLGGDFEQDTLYLFDESGILEKKMLCDQGVCRTFWTAEGVTDE